VKTVNSKLPVLIIGQGLAGTILAHTFLQRNIQVQIWNSTESYFTSSFAAGGIFNPITGRKLEETWLATEFFDYLFPFYQNLSTTLSASFFHPMPLFRPFANEESKNWLIARKPEIDHVFLDWSEEGVWVKKAGWLDVPNFLHVSRTYFSEMGIYQDRIFDFDQALPKDSFSQIIFCEGFHAQNQNPYFMKLPFLPAKGEIMLFKNASIQSESILNKNGFILPIGHHEFKVGATYRWDDLSENPNSNAIIDLEKKLHSFGVSDYEVLKVICGVRPATQDRRPFVGFHPSLPCAIFNGFGSKGVSLAPYFANQLVNEWMGVGEVNSEASIRRFNHLFSI
jgi:hypothetical protein